MSLFKAMQRYCPPELNIHNLKKGDIITVDEAWEDEAGNYHAERAEIVSISPTGELKLKWLAPKQIRDFLKYTDEYMANDYYN